jgi:hypothetical protein
VGTILLVLLLVLLLGGVPAWPYSRSWGYRPAGIVSLLLVILLVLLVMQVLPWGFTPVAGPVTGPVVVP